VVANPPRATDNPLIKTTLAATIRLLAMLIAHTGIGQDPPADTYQLV